MVEYDPQEEEVIRKLDIQIIPLLILISIWITTDRSLQLHVVESQVRFPADSISHPIGCLVVYSLGSLLFTFPSTLCYRFSATIKYIGLLLMVSGVLNIVTIMMSNQIGVIISKFLLGVVQSGLFPFILLYLSAFFTREEYATRLCYIFSFGLALAQPFVELLSKHILKADNTSDYTGIQWVYFIEGVGSFIVCAVVLIYLPNSPDTCWFLNTADKVLAVARGQDGYDAEIPIASTNTNGNSKKTEVFTFRYIHFLDGIKDFRIWLISFTYLVVSTGLDYIALVMPDISANIALQCNGNCSPAETNLYHVPLVVFFVAALPYAIGMVISYLISTHSDKTGERALHIACALVISTFGLFMLGLIDNVSFHTNIVRYIIGVLPAVIGLMSAIPSLLAYGMDRAVGDTHKVTLASVIVCLGQSFGLTLATASFSAQSFFGSCLSLSMFLIFGIGAVLAIRHLNHAEEQDMWGKGPGLRRLMNDADEAKAWDGDIEMDDFEFQKTNRVKEADEWE